MPTRLRVLPRLGAAAPLLAVSAALAASQPPGTAVGPPATGQDLLAQPTHLGIAGRPEWDWFRGRTPVGESLTLTFDSRPNSGEYTLIVRQQDVKEGWAVELNGRPLGTLVRMEASLVHALPVPAGALREGANTLRIACRTPGDDILLHDVRLEPVPQETLLTAASLRVRVLGDDGEPLPARVTVVDESGSLAALRPLPGPRQAVRPGVAYVATDPAIVGLRPGTYQISATRGPEYGRHRATVTLRAGDARELDLRLSREVRTDGWVAADTHIHTLEVSGHGDASLAERALTLAGEGVELAIATEHDVQADYAPTLHATGASGSVTPVVGTEVTTKTGHFNVFPAIAGHRGVEGPVTVLNHPHDTHAGFTPFDGSHFNAATGASRDLPRAFTAMEVVNSGAMRSDWMEPVRSWFALLNRGLRITPIGASDSHDVSRFIVGQGRTYVRAPDGDARRIAVSTAVESLRAGRVMVSLGLFAEARIGTAGPGDLVDARAATVVEGTVSGATWVRADRVTLFVNGVEAAHAPIGGVLAGRVRKADVRWPLPSRRHDYHVVVIARGPGVTDPSWAIPTPYQPTAPTWSPVVFALTAPIYVDADGDGVFSSARDYAGRLVEAHGASLPALFRALASHDAVVSSHAAELLEARGVDLAGEDVRRALRVAAVPVRAGVAAYLAAK
ncbi:hypothetical protein TBR22_A41440 [Luteitalea sp. TBR-22]|uniref:CehA/McbA family metallohydrolase n=1 Tax=Luteitalea sp. TBR-22 TaxID=2802971 RepID=UPI001AF5399D|nr:CehA/McbA family metallohydrolase [Luteitalea sp. TBR-22]BCS34918.1 hypothetical protein TBR22_A41440 [Luteitalea sp. TBR-22]